MIVLLFCGVVVMVVLVHDVGGNGPGVHAVVNSTECSKSSNNLEDSGGDLELVPDLINLSLCSISSDSVNDWWLDKSLSLALIRSRIKLWINEIAHLL
jgi:hypothetical protein